MASILGDINDTLSGLVQATATIQNLKISREANERARLTQQNLQAAREAKRVLDITQTIQATKNPNELAAIQPLVGTDPILQNLLTVRQGNLTAEANQFNAAVSGQPVNPPVTSTPVAVTEPAQPQPLTQVPQITNDEELASFLAAQGMDVEKLQEQVKTKGMGFVQKRVMQRLKARGFDTSKTGELLPIEPQTTPALPTQELAVATPTQPATAMNALQNFQALRETALSRGEGTRTFKKGTQTFQQQVKPLSDARAFNEYLNGQRKALKQNFSPAAAYRVGVNQPFVPQAELKKFATRHFDREVNSRILQGTRGKRLNETQKRDLVSGIVGDVAQDYITPSGAVFISEKYSKILDIPTSKFFDGSTMIGKIALDNGFATQQEWREFQVDEPLAWSSMLEEGLRKQGADLLAFTTAPQNFQMADGTNATSTLVFSRDGKTGVTSGRTVPITGPSGQRISSVASIQATGVDALSGGLKTKLSNKEVQLASAKNSLTDFQNEIASIPPNELEAAFGTPGALALTFTNIANFVVGSSQLFGVDFSAESAFKRYEQTDAFKRSNAGLSVQAQRIRSKYTINLFKFMKAIAPGDRITNQDIDRARDILGSGGATSIIAGTQAAIESIDSDGLLNQGMQTRAGVPLLAEGMFGPAVSDSINRDITPAEPGKVAPRPLSKTDEEIILKEFIPTGLDPDKDFLREFSADTFGGN